MPASPPGPSPPRLDFDTFHDGTFADWTACPAPRREPDFVSRSRSVYWDQGDAVVRASDHWGRARSCLWLLDGLRPSGPILAGRCRYADFSRFVPLTVERDRAVLVAPHAGPRLAGRAVSLLLPAATTGRRSLGRLGRRRRRPRRPVPAPGRGRPASGPPEACVREVVEVVAETDFVLLTRCGRRLARRSHGAAWFVDGAAAAPDTTAEGGRRRLPPGDGAIRPWPRGG